MPQNSIVSAAVVRRSNCTNGRVQARIGLGAQLARLQRYRPGRMVNEQRLDLGRAPEFPPTVRSPGQQAQDVLTGQDGKEIGFQVAVEGGENGIAAGPEQAG